MNITTQAQLNIYTACAIATQTQPVTRERLRQVTGLTDRMVRKEIERLRDNGIRICYGKSGGYWTAKTEAEYKDFRKAYASRFYKGLWTLANMDRATDGQVEMPSYGNND